MSDWVSLYRENLAAVLALVEDLSADQLDTVVPATPEWSVRQVLSHLAGGPADHLAGRTAGAPGPEWTSRHVAERAGRRVAELTREMRANEPGVLAMLGGGSRPAMVWDLVVHHADLREGLGLPALASRCWQPVLEAVRPAGDWAGVGDYELFRGRFSRRSRSQLARWPMPPGDIDEFGIFGPREDDQPVP